MSDPVAGSNCDTVPGPESELGGNFVEGLNDPVDDLNLVLILFQILILTLFQIPIFCHFPDPDKNLILFFPLTRIKNLVKISAELLVLTLDFILDTDIDPDSEPDPDPDPVPGAHPGWSCVTQQLLQLSDCVSSVSLALQGLFINGVSFFTLTHTGSCYTATHSYTQ